MEIKFGGIKILILSSISIYWKHSPSSGRLYLWLPNRSSWYFDIFMIDNNKTNTLHELNFWPNHNFIGPNMVMTKAQSYINYTSNNWKFQFKELISGATRKWADSRDTITRTTRMTRDSIVTFANCRRPKFLQQTSIIISTDKSKKNKIGFVHDSPLIKNYT